ncbi:MAG: GNAT family N-acetyltransferase [Rhodothermales bacterium]|nr:GNAT family N-acetyltransferase [Rhodothermales bacterium]MDG2017249.1 GNAT family N-acetyltransferase [Rhodothermales bacterium]
MTDLGYIAPLSLGDAEVPGLSIQEIGLRELDSIRGMNRLIFKEERVINSFDREDLLILEARLHGIPVGFKIGYRENRYTFYSAKGGVLPEYRRKGIALALMNEMVEAVEEKGYPVFAFDTFPNMHPGMTILALAQGFRLVKADFNTLYKEYRLRFERRLMEHDDLKKARR